MKLQTIFLCCVTLLFSGCAQTVQYRPSQTPAISQNEWMVNCNNSALHATRYCIVTRYGGTGFIILVTSDGEKKISSKGSHHPGTPIILRVDDNAPVYSENTVDGFFSAAQSERLIRQMLTGRIVRFGGTRWPSNPYQGEWSTAGLSGALQKAIDSFST